MHAIDGACSIVWHMINRNVIPFYRRPFNSLVLKGIAVSNTTRWTYLCCPKWAARPEYGTSLGENFVNPFAGDICEMVVCRCSDEDRKISAA